MEDSKVINKLYSLNQMFKKVYNSKKSFQNIWMSKNGRLFMYEEDQFPSFVEIYYETDEMVSKKGDKTSRGKEFDEFINLITTNNFKLNSVKLFNYFKENSKSDATIEIKDNQIIINNEVISEIYDPNEKTKEKLFDDREVVGEFKMTNECINKCIEMKTTPFRICLNFDTGNVDFNIKEKPESYLEFNINTKFMPFIEECNNSKESDVTIEVLSTECDYIYDVVFKVVNYTINKKGERVKNPIITKYGIRVLEL